MERILSRKQVVELTGRSATSLWRDCRNGRFPHPRSIGPGRIGWLASDVDAWIKALPIVGKAGPP